MGKRQFVVLLAILAGTFIAAEDAPTPEVAATDAPSNETDFESFAAEVGAEDGTIDPVSPPFVSDVSSGIAQVQATEITEDESEPMAAPGSTRFVVERIIYKWTIVNYDHHDMEFGEALYSPVFSGKNSPGYEWQLQFYPKGNDMKYRTYASLYLASVGKNGATPNVQFSIIDKNSRNVNVKKFNINKYTGQAIGFGNFVLYALIENAHGKLWAPNGKLTLVAEITFTPRVEQTSHCTETDSKCSSMPYGYNHFADVQLLTTHDEYIMRAQKAALAAHSTWFESQFEMDPYSDKVVLPMAVSAADMREVVQFIYSGKINPSSATKLKAVADQLGMSKLKELCEKIECKAEENAHRAPQNPQFAPAA